MYRYVTINPIVYPKSVISYILSLGGLDRQALQDIKDQEMKTFLQVEFDNPDNYNQEDERSIERGIIPEEEWLTLAFWSKADVFYRHRENTINGDALMTLCKTEHIRYDDFDTYVFSIGAAKRLDHALPKFVIERSKSNRVLVILFNPDDKEWGKTTKSDIDLYIRTICQSDSILHLTIIDTSFIFHSHPLSTVFFTPIVRHRHKRIFVLDFASGDYNPSIFIALKSYYTRHTTIRYINGYSPLIRSISTNNHDLIDVYKLKGVTQTNWTGPCYYNDRHNCPINTLSYHDFTTNTIMRSKIKSLVKGGTYTKKRSRSKRKRRA
jgi:hypothetical protein